MRIRRRMERERFYLPDGASFYFDTGHFALETHCDEIAAAIRDFLPGSR